jgi:maleylacetate reductase
MMDFVYTAQPQRVVFARGSVGRIAQEVDGVGSKRALVLCTPPQREQAMKVAQMLGDRSAGIFDGAEMHVPIEGARRARAHARAVGADCAVAVGGGSTIGLGKAIALEHEMPIIAIPTTYAGSEMTPVYGITEGGVKRTGRDMRVLARTVLYDPDLTMSLPLEMSVVSGINAIAHAAEGLYACDGNPVMSLMAEDGIRAMASGLKRLAGNSRDPQARDECLYGAWLCGTVLGHVGMSLHHKLCHTLGGTCNLPHAQTHTVVLPHALAYNRQAAPEAMSRIARALGVEDGPRGLYDLALELGAPTSLGDLGMLHEDVEKVVDLALANPYWNPAHVEREPLAALLERAWAGMPPT